MSKKDKDIVNLNLRLPKSLHTDLVVLAELESRSLNGQILYMLQREVEMSRDRDGDG